MNVPRSSCPRTPGSSLATLRAALALTLVFLAFFRLGAVPVTPEQMAICFDADANQHSHDGEMSRSSADPNGTYFDHCKDRDSDVLLVGQSVILPIAVETIELRRTFVRITPNRDLYSDILTTPPFLPPRLSV